MCYGKAFELGYNFAKLYRLLQNYNIKYLGTFSTVCQKSKVCRLSKIPVYFGIIFGNFDHFLGHFWSNLVHFEAYFEYICQKCTGIIKNQRSLSTIPVHCQHFWHFIKTTLVSDDFWPSTIVHFRLSTFPNCSKISRLQTRWMKSKVLHNRYYWQQHCRKKYAFNNLANRVKTFKSTFPFDVAKMMFLKWII